MPTSTTNFSFQKPLVNDPTDEDLWGGYLNDNFDSIDNILPAPAASKYGAIVVQSTDDAGYEILSNQGTSGQYLKSNGADALPSFAAAPTPSSATTSAEGIIELLTDAEFITGTDSTRAMVASNFVKSLGTSGYIKLPAGFMFQWGQVTASSSMQAVSFTTSFASACYGVIALGRENLARGFTATDTTTSGFTLNQFNTGSGAGTSDCDSFWIAIGV